MPPKPKYKKSEFVRAGLEILREKGVDSLTARDLGAKLGISSRPIFTAFSNMEELKDAVTDAGVEYFREYSKNFVEYTPAFKQMGMHFVSFAKKEPRLFEFLFIRKNPEAKKGLSAIESECINVISEENGLSTDEAKMLFSQVWIFTFGLATLLAMKACEYSEEEISDMLTRAFSGAVMMIKSDTKKTKTNMPEKKEEKGYEKS